MDRYLDEAIESICESIRFPSTEQPPLPGKPFGEDVSRCLAHFLALAARMGFETHDYDGYAGEVVFGDGTEEFAVLAHLDVVPAGNGWTEAPFGGVVKGGKIYGRGAVDDKGPAICVLYALKQLKDEGFVPAAKIKLIVGCNEESGWRCIEHYNKVARMPETGFSPDADFPVIYAEKGILQIELALPAEGDFSTLRGGERPNMVCDLCEAAAPAFPEKLRAFGLEYAAGKVVSRGRSAHGSTPEKGVNAIYPILGYLGADGALAMLDALKTRLGALKDETGALTLSPDVIRGGMNEISVTCDIRYPATLSERDVLSVLDACGARYRVTHRQLPLFTDKHGPLVSALLAVYEECTGQKAEPIAIGGGTYARALKNGVAFGPEMEGDDPVVHQADEYISVDRVKLLLTLYKKAIERLTK